MRAVALRYAVPGISCEHCKTSIEADVAAVPGVEAVEVDLEEQTVVVEGDPEADAVEAAIAGAGYAEVNPI